MLDFEEAKCYKVLIMQQKAVTEYLKRLWQPCGFTWG